MYRRTIVNRHPIMCGSDDQRQAARRTRSEGNHNDTMHTIRSDTQKRADVVYSDVVYSDVNHLAPRSKKPRVETATMGEEAGVRNAGRIDVVQKAFKQEDDERLKQEFDPSLGQPCSKGDAAATNARLRKLEQELHILEEELKNQNPDGKLYAYGVHNMTREATAITNGTYRAR
jgi:hypothetical protein